MYRLYYNISYNEEQWDIRGSRDAGYTLVHKKTFVSFFISYDVMGIEQVSDDEFLFLVHESDMSYELLIVRIKFDISNHESYKIYYKEFNNFHFLTEDIIIFDTDAHLSGATLYSISNNTEYNTLNNILGSEPDYRLIKDRSIELIYENSEVDDYPTALYVEYNFNPYSFNICAYLQVVLDVNTFKPISPVYSTLRDKYFHIDDTVTLGQIAKEDSYYADKIGAFLSSIYSKDNRKDLEELINMEKK